MATTTATSGIQVQDSEKRRKQTIERAKATHLSRQLQLRLQYARLKVDHGWQKQNLNEVENLYFHHSQTRGSTQPYPSPLLLATTQREGPPTVSNGNQAKPPVSFRLGVKTNATVDTELLSPVADGQPTPGYHTPTATTPVLQPNSAVNTPRPSITAADFKSLIPMDTDNASKRSVSPIISPPTSNSLPSSNSLQRSDTLVSTRSPASPWSSTSQPTAPASPSYYARISNSQSGTPAVENSRNSFSSGASLTYDSFWSSHTSSTVSSSFRNTSGTILPAPAPAPIPVSAAASASATPPDPASIARSNAENGLNLIWEASSFVKDTNTKQSPARSRAPRSAANRSLPVASIPGQEAIAAT